MRLEPNSKPVKMRIVSGGMEHSTMESLRRHFTLDDVLPLLESGSLLRWLKQVGATDTIERVTAFRFADIKNPTPEEKICFWSIFDSRVHDGRSLFLIAEQITDPEEQRKRMKEAACLESSDACFWLARYYEKSGNWQEIVDWHEKAVLYGGIESLYELGLIYDHGLYGCATCKETAFDYYKQAYSKGNHKSAVQLGLCYYDGVGTVRDIDKAVELFSAIVGKSESPLPAYYLGQYYAEKEVWEKAFDFFSQSARLDYKPACHKLAELNFNCGNYHKAIEQYEALAKEDRSALCGIGKCFEALGDKENAKKCYQKAVERNYAQGCCDLARVEENDLKRRAYYRRAADSGILEGMEKYAYSLMYDGGGFASSDEAMREAVVYFKLAAKRGSNDAKFELALAYLDGKGTKRMPEDALRLLKELDKDNYAAAQVRLGDIYVKSSKESDKEIGYEYLKKVSGDGGGLEASRLYERSSNTYPLKAKALLAEIVRKDKKFSNPESFFSYDKKMNLKGRWRRESSKYPHDDSPKKIRGFVEALKEEFGAGEKIPISFLILAADEFDVSFEAAEMAWTNNGYSID